MYYHTTEAREIPRLRACTHSIPDAFLSHVYTVRFAIYGRRSSPIATSKAVHFGRQCESESQACVCRRFSSREGGTRSMGEPLPSKNSEVLVDTFRYLIGRLQHSEKEARCLYPVAEIGRYSYAILPSSDMNPTDSE